jgi:YhcN/YlaJ family sporulation lipoprotein
MKSNLLALTLFSILVLNGCTFGAPPTPPEQGTPGPQGGQLNMQREQTDDAQQKQQRQPQQQEQQNQQGQQLQGQYQEKPQQAPERREEGQQQEQGEQQTAQQRAERLAALAAEIDQVNDATAVVIGNWAIVGVDIDADLQRAEVGTIKYTVAEALKSDPHGARAIVTADPDLNKRLDEMAQSIREGAPLAGVMEELAGIIGRIMPQLPRDIPQAEQGQGQQGQQEQQVPQG